MDPPIRKPDSSPGQSPLFVLDELGTLFACLPSMDLHPKQREKMADMFLDLSKILIGAFVLGPFLALQEHNKPINFILVEAGVLCSTIGWFTGIVLSRPKEGR